MDRPTTLAELIDGYRADWAPWHRRPRSLEGPNLFERASGALRLEAVDAARLDRCRRERRPAGITVATLARNLAALSGAFDFASRPVTAGVPLDAVRERLGHARLAMTLRFAHLGRDHQQAAVERLDGGRGRER